MQEFKNVKLWKSNLEWCTAKTINDAINSPKNQELFSCNMMRGELNPDLIRSDIHRYSIVNEENITMSSTNIYMDDDGWLYADIRIYGNIEFYNIEFDNLKFIPRIIAQFPDDKMDETLENKSAECVFITIDAYTNEFIRTLPQPID